MNDLLPLKGKIAKLQIKLKHKLEMTATSTDVEQVKKLWLDVENIRNELKICKVELLEYFDLANI